ncbi:hypothetical protein A6456_33720 [Paraburkholderia tropica]|nr:hypothetical protein A6456_33720 [Paraburkholderia tropica]
MCNHLHFRIVADERGIAARDILMQVGVDDVPHSSMTDFFGLVENFATEEICVLRIYDHRSATRQRDDSDVTGLKIIGSRKPEPDAGRHLLPIEMTIRLCQRG